MTAADRLTIFVDGPDHAGKSTLIPQLRRGLEHKAQVWERWIGTDFVYSAIRADSEVWDVAKWSPQFDEAPHQALARWHRLHPMLTQVVVLPSVEVLVHRALCAGDQLAEILALNLTRQRLYYKAWADYCRQLGYPTITLFDDCGCAYGEYARILADALGKGQVPGYTRCGTADIPVIATAQTASATRAPLSSWTIRIA